MEFQKLFLYIPGLIIFLVGSGMVRNDRRYKRLGSRFTAVVENCAHVVKKDQKNRIVMNYYNVTVSYFSEKTNRMEKLNVKSASEFAIGQSVNLFRGSAAQEPVIDDVKAENIFGPWVMAIGGALLILLAYFTNQDQLIPAMAILGFIFFGAGVSLLNDYLKLKKRNLQPVTAEIKDVYERQLAKGTKIAIASKYTYYPIVTYTLEGKLCMRRCNINSSDKRSFKVGETMTLYYDEAKKEILEKNAKIGYLITAIVLIVISVLVVGSTASELIRIGGFGV